jgi:hypothetical protein
MGQSQLDRDRKGFLAHGFHSLGLPALFYGSLRAPEIFEIVIGRSMADARIEKAALANHTLARIIAGDGFPGIFPSQGAAELTCLLVSGLTWEEELRVSWYEWDEYKLDRLTLRDGRIAQTFVPDIDAIHRLHGSIDFQPWTFEEWARSRLASAIPNARAWMDEMPVLSSFLERESDLRGPDPVEYDPAEFDMRGTACSNVS